MSAVVVAVVVVAVVLVVLAVIGFLAGRFGADSRPRNPACAEPQWPFARYER